MKKIIITTLLITAFSFSNCHSQSNDSKLIKSVITSFSKAGDTYDSESLANYLAKDYRIIMNRQFGSKTVSIVTKSDYIKNIKSKKWGGDSRVLTFENITINKSSASVKVISKGKKSIFHSIFVLIKDDNGLWKIISDIPIIS